MERRHSDWWIIKRRSRLKRTWSSSPNWSLRRRPTAIMPSCSVLRVWLCWQSPPLVHLVNLTALMAVSCTEAQRWKSLWSLEELLWMQKSGALVQCATAVIFFCTNFQNIALKVQLKSSTNPLVWWWYTAGSYPWHRGLTQFVSLICQNLWLKPY